VNNACRILVIAIVLATPYAIGAQAQVAAEGPSMQVILLGTQGGPSFNAQRIGIETLVVAGGQRLLFDAGRAVTTGMSRAAVNPADITRVFITHLHSDHVISLPELLISPGASQGRAVPLEVWGPEGHARTIAEHHTDGEEAGRVLQQASPKLAVFSHYSVDPQATLPLERRHYQGPVEFGEDLMITPSHQSALSAVAASTRVARMPGTRLAIAATATSTTGACLVACAWRLPLYFYWYFYTKTLRDLHVEVRGVAGSVGRPIRSGTACRQRPRPAYRV
jgi:Metallo-beta-lactamase superfamily